MAHEELTTQIIDWLKVFTMKQAGKVAHARGVGSSVGSAQAILSRNIKPMVELGQLNKDGSVYTLPGLTGTGEHALKITDAIIEVVSRWDADVRREHRIKEVALQPDVMMLVRNGERKCCLIIEVMQTETEQYFAQKKSTWEGWKDNNYYLSGLFGVEVPYFHLVTYGKEVNGVLTLEEAISRMEGE